MRAGTPDSKRTYSSQHKSHIQQTLPHNTNASSSRMINHRKLPVTKFTFFHPIQTPRTSSTPAFCGKIDILRLLLVEVCLKTMRYLSLQDLASLRQASLGFIGVLMRLYPAQICNSIVERLCQEHTDCEILQIKRCADLFHRFF